MFKDVIEFALKLNKTTLYHLHSIPFFITNLNKYQRSVTQLCINSIYDRETVFLYFFKMYFSKHLLKPDCKPIHICGTG